MSKKLIIKIKKDGTIESETKGIKGKKCENYIPLIEKLTDSKVINKEYTQEYYENTDEIHNQAFKKITN
ncbi:DUF2997 domain-containing protein [Methanosphaera sp. ISO3-F5]|uniref:DUF2997 domain-containing protein n=1 Tax=Methanosphaera sp. ISO3-F5 TaxID=1452353 RepID=UPI002B263EC4|nr:DUF2997 domain-containing protein [Methanosphaera sp. ISO3-F5]WQH63675.1 DUF2997 domain-containing protein [Methanosphaera sp. ISO3-F5]